MEKEEERREEEKEGERILLGNMRENIFLEKKSKERNKKNKESVSIYHQFDL